jgi:FtsZ-interacting cell division protein ZipA
MIFNQSAIRMAKYYKKISCFLLYNIPEDESQSEEDEPLCKIDEEDENVGKVRLDEDELLLGKIPQDENERRAKDQLEEDEQLAKAIQLSLNLGSPRHIGSPPQHGNGSLSQPSPHVFPPGFR